MDAYVSMATDDQPSCEPGTPKAHATADRIHPYGEVMTVSQFLSWSAGDALASENAQ